MKVGIAGTGKMGAAIAGRLLPPRAQGRALSLQEVVPVSIYADCLAVTLCSLCSLWLFTVGVIGVYRRASAAKYFFGCRNAIIRLRFRARSSVG